MSGGFTLSSWGYLQYENNYYSPFGQNETSHWDTNVLLLYNKWLGICYRLDRTDTVGHTKAFDYLGPVHNQSQVNYNELGLQPLIVNRALVMARMKVASFRSSSQWISELSVQIPSRYPLYHWDPPFLFSYEQHGHHRPMSALVMYQSCTCALGLRDRVPVNVLLTTGAHSNRLPMLLSHACLIVHDHPPRHSIIRSFNLFSPGPAHSCPLSLTNSMAARDLLPPVYFSQN